MQMFRRSDGLLGGIVFDKGESVMVSPKVSSKEVVKPTLRTSSFRSKACRRHLPLSFPLYSIFSTRTW